MVSTRVVKKMEDAECEREAAFAGAGDKRQVFDNYIKARGY